MKPEPLAPDIQRLLAAERDFPPEPPERYSRVLTALDQLIGPDLPPSSDSGSGSDAEPGSSGSGGDPGPTGPPVDPGAGAAGASATQAATSATAGTAAGSAAVTAGMSKLLVVGLTAFMAGGLTGAGAYHVISAPDTPPSLTVQADPAPPSPTRPDPEPTRPPAEPELVAAPEEPASDDTEAPRRESIEPAPIRPRAQRRAPQPRPAPREEASPDSADGIDEGAEERQLLEIARAAVARGNASTAIAAINRHAQQYPRGRLSEEREALRILALVAAGRRQEAGRRAQQFRAAYPRSVFEGAIERSLRTEGE